MSSPGWARHVLVIDDHPFVRLTLKGMLVNAGVEHVTEAADGREAIARLSDPAGHFDLIFCDLQMPGVDGIETLREIAQIGTEAAIVLVSGEEEGILEAAENVARSYGLSTLGHVTKPIAAEQVRGFLRRDVHAQAGKARALPRTDLTDEDLRAGIQAGDVYALFQPKVDVQTGALMGVEALARWRHPRLGTISPGDFIPLAEKSETIELLTLHIQKCALEAQSQWRTVGRDVKVAINISTSTMNRLDLPDRLARAIAELQGKPSDIVLEITESRVADNIAILLDICARLRLKGLQLSIDDFGTGFSTLEQLGRLPFSELKVDQSFVSGAPDNERKRTLLESSLALAKKLKLRSVCEGVETQAEWELVKSLGTDYVQGYFVAKPLTVDDLQKWQFDTALLRGR